MKNIFVFLFWCIGFKYTEGEMIREDDFTWFELKANDKYNNDHRMGVTEKWFKPFNDRWRFFRIVFRLRNDKTIPETK